MIDLISTHDDEMWIHWGSRERYRAGMAKRAYDAARAARERAEQAVRHWESEVARVNLPSDPPWGDAGSEVPAQELPAARRRLADAVEVERQVEATWRAAEDAAAPPRQLSADERRLEAAIRQHADAEKGLQKVEAEAQDARDEVARLRGKATPKEKVEAARLTVAIADAEAEADRLRGVRDAQARQVEKARLWVQVRQTAVDGADWETQEAAFDAYDEYTEETSS